MLNEPSVLHERTHRTDRTTRTAPSALGDRTTVGAQSGPVARDEARTGSDRTTDRGVSGTEPAKAPEREYEHLEPVLDEYTSLALDDRRRPELRDQLIVGFAPVAQHLARRFAQRGVPVEDLSQVATVGLINAVDRYDPELARGGFLAFAVPTMTGEIRRYFRDHTWSMRVPRRLKELHLEISTVSSTLAGELGRAPKPSEIAARLDISVEQVLEGLQAAQAYASSSLDQQLTGDGENGAKLADLLGRADARLELAEDRHVLRPLLAALPERERTILMLRFYGEQTQSQIAEVVGVSQMHVSRLISTTLARLREQLTAD